MARRKGDILEPAGLAADWSDSTVKQDMKAYGLWLQYLTDRNGVDCVSSPGERLTKSNLNGFTNALDKRVSTTTVAARLSTLGRMIRVLDKDADRSWLFELQRRYSRRARPCRNKQPKIIHPATILKMTMEEMDKEQDYLKICSRKQFTRYRDLLILACLITLPIRLSNLRNLELGQSFIRERDNYTVQLSASETKNSQPYTAPLPHQLTKYLDIYVYEVRPKLLGQNTGDFLWVSFRFGHVASQTIYLHMKSLTKILLKQEITPHNFRDIAATYLAVHHPDQVRSAAAVLGHRSFKTTQKHYNQANMLTALRQFHQAI